MKKNNPFFEKLIDFFNYYVIENINYFLFLYIVYD